jgi:WS/DGAT/MGAT family acyltransferase
MRQLTPLDDQFLALEDGRTFGHIAGLAVYGPTGAPGMQLTFRWLLDHFAERLPLLPPFRERLVEVPFGIDHPYWVEDQYFDLEYHVRELALPAPGDDAQLATQVARLLARPLDRSRPLWEAYLISGLEGDRVAVLTKIHHAVLDGLSGAEVVLALTDYSPEGRKPPPPSPTAPPPTLPSQWEMLARGLLGFSRQPWRTLSVLPRTLRHLDENPALRLVPGVRLVGRAAHVVSLLRLRRDTHRDGEILEGPRVRTPRTRFNGPVSSHRRVAFATLPLADIKAIKNHCHVTVNDVVVTLCAGAMRRWLARRDELPDRPLVAMVPLSVRTPEQAGTFGNQISTMMVPIPTHEPDPAERIAFTHGVLASAKTVHRAIPATVMQDAEQFVPPAVLARASRVVMAALSRAPVEPACNLVVSNVPGSPLPLYLGETPMIATYPLSPIAHSCGVNITALSYQDGLDVGVVTDREQVPDAWEIIEALREELAALGALLPSSAPGLHQATKAPRRRQGTA